MTTSLYMPSLTVEIAFDAGFQTPAASRTWTDVSDYVVFEEGLTITVGRQNERSQADANQLSLVLNNSDGRFTAGNTSSPYYPNVKLDRPIRVTATPVDGPAQVEFVGYVNEWPLDWSDGIDATAYAPVTASSRLARLGTAASLANLVSQATLADSPKVYYTLGEQAGATQANDSSGNSAAALVIDGDPTLPLAFGSDRGPLGGGSATGAKFLGGQYLHVPFTPTATVSVTVEAFFKVDAIPAVEQTFIQVNGLSGVTSLGIAPSTGVIRLFSGDTTSGNVCDGLWHHIAARPTSTSTELYLDGTLVFTVAGAFTMAPVSLYVGGSPLEDASGVHAPFVGDLAHVALWYSSLTAAQIASHATAGLTGYLGETVDVRFERYAGYAGIPAAEVDAETSTVAMAHVDTTDKQVVEMMRTAETTEGGVLFDDRSGALTLHNRAHRYVTSSLFSLDMAQHMVESNYQPRLDRTYILNDVTVSNLDNTVTAHKVDAASQTDYGRISAGLETADPDDDAPLMLAAWQVYKYKDPRERTATLSVDTTAQVGKTPNCAAVMAANVGNKITVANRPAQAASSSVSHFVEGYTRSYSPESVMTTFNVSPSSPEDQVLVIGDATRGVIGTNPVAF